MRPHERVHFADSSRHAAYSEYMDLRFSIFTIRIGTMQNRDLITKTWSILLSTIPGISEFLELLPQASGTCSQASSQSLLIGAGALLTSESRADAGPDGRRELPVEQPPGLSGSG